MKKQKANISMMFKYLLLGICFLSLSINLFSSFSNDSSTEKDPIKKEQSQKTDHNQEELRFSGYEALVPSVHFSILFQFCSIIDIGVIESPVEILKDSLPLFTRPYYRTLFRMIISPNAP